MVSSVEMVLWAIHHATTLLFGVFASAALCGIEINRRHALELVLVGAVTGCAFGLANAVGGELFARQVYPLVVHLPLVIYLCARYRLSPLLAVLGITSAYLSCQFSNWMGIAAFAATDSQIAYYLARIATTLAVFAVLLHWAGDIGPRLAIKSTTELGILLILPLVYYVFDYATNVYTTLFHSGSVVTVEFLAFALCAFYLMFLPFTCANTKKRKPPSESAGCSKPATAPPSKSSRLGVNLGASCRFFATTCATSYAAWPL